MSSSARRAEALIGTPFRLQGRNPRIALDCVGLVAEAFQLPVCSVPRSYGHRRHDVGEIDALLEAQFRRVSLAARRVGDLLVLQCGSDQFHLGVVGDRGLIHADAGLGRVVCRPWPALWLIVRVYRRRQRRK